MKSRRELKYLVYEARRPGHFTHIAEPALGRLRRLAAREYNPLKSNRTQNENRTHDGKYIVGRNSIQFAAHKAIQDKNKGQRKRYADRNEENQSRITS